MRSLHALRVVVCGLGFTLPALAAGAAEDYVWWEAETPKATNFPAKNYFQPANDKERDVLSAGQWIGTSDKRSETLFLEYDVTVPKEAEYNFYVRKFWKHGPFKWRFDEQPWAECGKDVPLMDSVELRLHVGANWVSLGKVKLKAGAHKLRLELLENEGAACFDCFVLSIPPLQARGKMKPGEKYNRAPEGWFAFEPDADSNGATPAPIDLRSLNEKMSGEGGFIQSKGEEFIHSKTGKPVRFWAINLGTEMVKMDHASVDQLARFLAKHGVNMVRCHGGAFKREAISQVDPEYLDKMCYFISAMKSQGIYVCLSIYFPLWLNLSDKDGFPGYTGNVPFALLYFNPKFQEIYRNWWKTLFTAKNPYLHNAPLNQEPTIAFVEIINEDSYLFWTFKPYASIPAPQMEILEKLFGEWLTKKYGSLDKAFAAWGKDKGNVKGDDTAAGRAGFIELYAMFKNKTLRGQDTAEFLARNQKDFYEKTTAYLKKDLGFKGSVYASNWTTADPQVLGPLDKWSCTVADHMDRHGYFSGPHEGPRASYSISAGDKYDDQSALLLDQGGKKGTASLPIMDMMYNGKPSTITEIGWCAPNRYRADLPLLAAAYGALQGTDAIFFFAAGTPGWQDSLSKFPIMIPTMAGQFPATALIYRKGLVQPGEKVVEADLKLADLFALKGAPVTAPQNLDELRAADVPAGKSAEVKQVSSIDPLAFLTGKVAVDLTETGGKSKLMDLTKLIDRDKKTVQSTTGELNWNYDQGLVTVNAPKAQGVTGFLSKAGDIKLGSMTIKSDMEYGAIVLVALDDQPLKTSGRMLLQVMSEDNNFGWSAPGTGKRNIAELGGPPIVVKKFSGQVTLTRPDAGSFRVVPLDFNGYPVKDKSAPYAGKIDLAESTLYYAIEKAGAK